MYNGLVGQLHLRMDDCFLHSIWVIYCCICITTTSKLGGLHNNYFIHNRVGWLYGLCQEGRFFRCSCLGSLMSLQSAGGAAGAGMPQNGPIHMSGGWYWLSAGSLSPHGPSPVGEVPGFFTVWSQNGKKMRTKATRSLEAGAQNSWNIIIITFLLVKANHKASPSYGGREVNCTSWERSSNNKLQERGHTELREISKRNSFLFQCTT